MFSWKEAEQYFDLSLVDTYLLLLPAVLWGNWKDVTVTVMFTMSQLIWQVRYHFLICAPQVIKKFFLQIRWFFLTSDISIPLFSVAVLQNVHENSQTKTWPLSLDLKLLKHDLFLTAASLVQSRGQFLGLWDNSWDWWTPTGRYLVDLSCCFVGYICSVFGIQRDTKAGPLHVEKTSFISLKFSRWDKSTFREVKMFFWCNFRSCSQLPHQRE